MTTTLPTPEGPVTLEPSGDTIQVVLQEPRKNKVTTWTREDRDALLEGDTLEIPHPDHADHRRRGHPTEPRHGRAGRGAGDWRAGRDRDRDRALRRQRSRVRP
jgi:hypothetical protein